MDFKEAKRKFAQTRIIELDPQPFIEVSEECTGVAQYIGADRLAILYHEIFDLMQRVDQIEQNPKKFEAESNGDKSRMQAMQAEFMFASNINNLKAWHPAHRPGKIEGSGYFDVNKGVSESALSAFLNKATDGEQQFVETGVIDLFSAPKHQVLKRKEIFNVILQLYYRQLSLALYDKLMAHDINDRRQSMSGRSFGRFISQRMFTFNTKRFFQLTALRPKLTREQGAILEDRLSLLYSMLYQAINKYAAVEREPHCFTYPNDPKKIKQVQATREYLFKHIDEKRSWTPEWTLNHPELTDDFFPGMSVKEKYFMDKGIIDRWKTATAGYAVIPREEIWHELTSYCYQQLALALYEFNCNKIEIK